MSVLFDNISEDIISSRNNPLVIKVSKLDDKKYRDSEGLFRFDGIKLFFEAIECRLPLEYVLLRQSSAEEILSELEKRFDGKETLVSGRLIRLSDSAFAKISNEKSPEGIICVSKHLDNFHNFGKINKNEDFLLEGKLLLLESVRDPGNLGTIMRSAAAFGYSALILSSDCADVYNSKTLRASMGAAFRVKTIKVESIAETVKELRYLDRRVFAAALDDKASRLGEIELLSTDCFLIGNEGHGLTIDAVSECNGSVFIPMCENTESLNASVAASVCMWEQSRRGFL